MALFGGFIFPWAVWTHILNLIILLAGGFLMLLVLIQRGKGGGLAGAFGGAGGSSPFGSRAADQFVKITLWAAGVWVLLIMIHVKIVKADVDESKTQPLTSQRTAPTPPVSVPDADRVRA